MRFGALLTSALALLLAAPPLAHTLDPSASGSAAADPVVSAATAASSGGLNWTDCDISNSYLYKTTINCATVRVPVCYDSACGSARTHGLKLLRRRAANATGAPALLVLHDSGSVRDTADFMDRIVEQNNATAMDVYAFQTRLWTPPMGDDAGADMATTPCGLLAANFGSVVSVDNAMMAAVQRCSDWLTANFGAGGANAFSLDSATRDVATALDLLRTQELNSESPLYLLASGRASWVSQRLILTSTNTTVAGYIYDTPLPMKINATQDAVTGEAMDLLMSACDSDATCHQTYASASLTMGDVLTDMYKSVEKNPNGGDDCTKKLVFFGYNATRDIKPVHGVRRLIARMRRHTSAVKIVPPILYRLKRCTEKDATFIQNAMTRFQYLEENALALAWRKGFVELVTSYSELWPSPPPVRDELVTSFESTLINDGKMTEELPTYCAFTGSDSSVCRALFTQTSDMKSSLALTYAAPTTGDQDIVGSSANVLILTSRLNVNGSSATAKSLYEAFTSKATSVQTALLVQSDTFSGNELEHDSMMQLVGLFVAKQLNKWGGKWYLDDVASLITTSSAVPGKSTFMTAPVTIDLTVNSDDTKIWYPRFYYGPRDYGSDEEETEYGFFNDHLAVIMVVGFVAAGILGLSIRYGWISRCMDRRRRRRDAQSASQQSPSVPQLEPLQLQQPYQMQPPYQMQQPQYLQQSPHLQQLPRLQQPYQIQQPYEPQQQYHQQQQVQPPQPADAPVAWVAQPVNDYAWSYTPTTNGPRNGHTER